MATIQEQIGSVRKVFGPNWNPSVSNDLQGKGILGAVKISGSPDVYTIGSGGGLETPDSFKAKFGTLDQNGIVGEVSPEQAAELGITPTKVEPIKSLSSDDLVSGIPNSSLTDLMKKNEDIYNKKLEALNSSDLADIRDKYLGTFTPSDTERTLTNDINTKTEAYNQAKNDLEKNVYNLEGQGRGIPLGVIRGQQEKLYTQGNLSLNTLLNEINGMTSRLKVAQDSRQSDQDRLNALLGFSKEDKQTNMDILNALESQNKGVLDILEKYTTIQRQKFSDILSSLNGVNPANLDINTLNKIGQIAGSYGIASKDIVAALQSKYDKDLYDKLSTSVVETGGRKYLINDKTGDRIADLGSSSSGSGGGGTATERKATAIQGAIKEIAGFLNGVIGSDGKVSPMDYQKARNMWISKGYSSNDFDNNFNGYIDQTHASDYGAKWTSKSAESSSDWTPEAEQSFVNLGIDQSMIDMAKAAGLSPEELLK